MLSLEVIKKARELIESSLEKSSNTIFRIQVSEIADILADPDTMELYDTWNEIFFEDEMEVENGNAFLRLISSEFFCVGFCDLETVSEIKIILKPNKCLSYPR